MLALLNSEEFSELGLRVRSATLYQRAGRPGWGKLLAAKESMREEILR